jgi:hypothetical protein
MTGGSVREWHEIAPADAVNILLPHPDIRGPLTMDGEVCPWPWEPQQLGGAPLGMYHCPYCGEMVVAGHLHTDYREADAEEGS